MATIEIRSLLVPLAKIFDEWGKHLIRYLLCFELFLVVRHSLKKPSLKKKSSTEKTAKKPAKAKKTGKTQVQVQETVKKSSRPADEVVTYAEFDYELKEMPAQGSKVLIGPPWLTRFERARITGSRALQLSLGAPPLINVPDEARSSIALAVTEIEHKALPISIRRILPNGHYQDIPTDWMR
ncbi:MAG TPA: DNA-directed RNA polymerase subunit K [Nitrososphaera sp.]|nr:DNA-directed RNA polymerase subunit K [Nitrososphaera sp.]